MGTQRPKERPTLDYESPPPSRGGGAAYDRRLAAFVALSVAYSGAAAVAPGGVAAMSPWALAGAGAVVLGIHLVTAERP